MLGVYRFWPLSQGLLGWQCIIGSVVSYAIEHSSMTHCCDSNRVERGLYVCGSCETTMNAAVNGAVNIRRKITQSPLPGIRVTTTWYGPKSTCSIQPRVRSTHKNRQPANPNTPNARDSARVCAGEDVY